VPTERLNAKFVTSSGRGESYPWGERVSSRFRGTGSKCGLLLGITPPN
jgi:hypothetical protein